MGRIVILAGLGLLVACSGDALETRLAALRPRVAAAATAEKAAGDEETLWGVVGELVRAGDYEAIEALERECRDPERRRVFRLAVARAGRGAEARRLLERWAAADPDAVELAAYREDGLDYLLARLEDPAEPARVRAECVQALARAGDRSVLPRLRALADDPTPVPMRSLRAGSGLPTLGSIVRRCIAELEG